MIDIGVTMFLHGDDYGRDPRAFIGWANDTKLVFFYAMLAAAGLSVILCFVIIFNISTPQTRKDSVVEQLSRCEIFGFFSSRSLKTREKYISFAQFVYFSREVSQGL